MKVFGHPGPGSGLIAAIIMILSLAALMAPGCDDDREAGGVPSGDTGADGPNGAMGAADGRHAADRLERLGKVDSWFYYLAFDEGPEVYEKMVPSAYDMIVMEPVFTEKDNTDFDMAAVVQNLHGAAEPKLVIAYIDIGQAEEWRTYWRSGWGIGEPDWIAGSDPDGWEGNYPVAFWDDEWKSIWLGGNGYIQQLLDAGFDGVYLDWVEAYSDEAVRAAADRDGVYATGEMIRWVDEIAAYGRARDPGFIVIAQNGAGLVSDDDYTRAIDAIAQEHVWFDGGADNEPPGDCPLPRTRDDVDSDEYVAGLPEECRRNYEDYPDGTLHTSSEEYIEDLTVAREKGLVVFTVDYATEPENIEWVYRTSRSLGFIPFASERDLGVWVEPER